MLILLSPAKSLNFESDFPQTIPTEPRLLKQSAQLVRAACKLKTSDLMSLMNVSEKIAALNVTRFKNWKPPFTFDNAKPALYAFVGDVYLGMQPLNWSEENTLYAQTHVRILSGLYGVLRPFDLMQPYRLEMKTPLENKKGKNLYAFWKKDIVSILNTDLTEQGDSIIVNLVSQEYYKAVDTKKIKGQVYQIEFKENKNGVYKIISFSAKRARGMMCDYIVRNKIIKITDLKSFDYEGYAFNETMSSEYELVFTR